MLSDFHKAWIGALAGGLVAGLGVIAGAMSGDQTLADVTAQTWLFAIIAFITGAGLTGGSVAVSKANTIKGVDPAAFQIEPNPVDPNEVE